MGYEKCQICGMGGFQTWGAYNHHHESRHNVKPKAEGLVIDSIELVQTYRRMNPTAKQMIVEKTETAIRLKAWDKAKLNPLIGCDKHSSEPIWDKERNII